MLRVGQGSLRVARAGVGRLALVTACLMVVAPAALATDYKGATAYWAPLSVSINGGQVTALATQSARVPCPGQSSDVDPVSIKLASPVAITGGSFQAQGTSATDYNRPVSWTISGTVSLDQREVSGTLTVNATDYPSGAACQGTYNVDAIIPPSGAPPPSTTTFTGGPPPAGGYDPRVGFTYAHGVITHLTAGVGVVCPSTTEYPAQLYSTSYRLDPIPVARNGNFRIQAAVLDDYGVVIHYVLAGSIHGNHASGTVSAYRESWSGNIGDSSLVKCSRSLHWTSIKNTSAGSGPAAFFEVVPFRYGRAGAWQYYLITKLTGCSDANRASVHLLGGPSRSVSCYGQVKFGPLIPQRNYEIAVTALKTKRGRTVAKATAPPIGAYLPGDDGNWILLN